MYISILKNQLKKKRSVPKKEPGAVIIQKQCITKMPTLTWVVIPENPASLKLSLHVTFRQLLSLNTFSQCSWSYSLPATNDYSLLYYWVTVLNHRLCFCCSR